MLVIKSATASFYTNSIIPVNNLTKQKSYLKPTRYKAVSSYVKKAKKTKLFPVLTSSDFEAQQLEGDDRGSDENNQDSREDSIYETPLAFLTPVFNQPQYAFSLGRYNSFVQFNIPPPKYN